MYLFMYWPCRLCSWPTEPLGYDGTHFLQCISRFSQGLRLRQVDLIMDDIAGSSATLSKMSQKVREACTIAMDKLQQKKGQRMGGRHTLF